MLKKVLVVNRGEIACRIISTLKKMNIVTVAVFSQTDSKAIHARMADEAYLIGQDLENSEVFSNQSADSYANIEQIINVAKKAKVDGVHPGYGFLAENFHFARRVSEEGINFIGPHFSLMERMSDKMSAKNAAAAAGVSVVPGFKGKIRDYMHAIQIAEEIGYPVMLKAVAGGGGKGMRVVKERSEMEFMYNIALQEISKLYENTDMLVEKFIENGRHIEMQILGDKHGNVICLGDRECSIQRRNQKVIEETPSPFMTEKVRQRMMKECIQFAKKENYFSAGTIEFIVDKDCNFYFLEVNTRIQVEHRITEMVTGIDIVEQMVLIACDYKLPFRQKDIKIRACFECRLCAEDSQNGFIPSSGVLKQFLSPEINKENSSIYDQNQEYTMVIDSGVESGDQVSPFYDSMIAKVCTKAKDRRSALNLMLQVLNRIFIDGLDSNITFLSEILLHEKFMKGDFSTKFIEEYYPDNFEARKVDARWFHIPIFAVLFHHLYENFSRNQYQDFNSFLQDFHQSFIIMIENQKFVKIDIESFDAESQFLSVNFQRKRYEIFYDLELNNSFIKILIKNEDHIEEHFVFLKREKFYGYFVKFFNMELSLKIFNEDNAHVLQKIPLESFQDNIVDENVVISPITGLISEVLIKEGDSVKKDDVLCIISAMKMENLIKVHKDGIINKVNIKKNDNVQKDDVLFEIS